YLSYDTVIETKIYKPDSIQLPAIAICPFYSFNHQKGRSLYPETYKKWRQGGKSSDWYFTVKQFLSVSLKDDFYLPVCKLLLSNGTIMSCERVTHVNS